VIRVGPAGWSYPDWEGVVYPAGAAAGFHPLRFLTRYVDCVEVNSTFYAIPPSAVVEGWVRALFGAPEFAVTVKLHRDFTHRERADSREDLEREARLFHDAIEPLRRAQRLRAILLQFPHTFHHTPPSVRRLGALHGLFEDTPLVLEVRHASWFEPPALAAIRGLGYSLAHIDLPGAWDHPPPWHPRTGKLGYLRLHGRNRGAWFDAKAGRDQKYDYLYDEREIAQLAARAKRIAAEHDETIVITNNHFNGKAVVNALELLAQLRGRKPLAPADLVRAYPHLKSQTLLDGQQDLF
jgi:uncharacterized protein YecE (DUF72 family)